MNTSHDHDARAAARANGLPCPAHAAGSCPPARVYRATPFTQAPVTAPTLRSTLADLLRHAGRRR
jgi:hypothetical protein